MIRERQHTAPLVDTPGTGGVSTPVIQARRTDDGSALLVRPDGYIAWAGSTADPSEASGWRRVLRQWNGTAT